MPTKLYLRDTTASNAPSAEANLHVNANLTSANANTCLEMSETAGSSVTNETHANSAAQGYVFMRMWASPALQGQTLPAGTTFKAAVSAKASSIGYNCYPFFYVYLYRPGVGKVAELSGVFNNDFEVSSSTGVGVVLTSKGTRDDIAIKEGDKIIFEVWFYKDSTSSVNAGVLYNGTTEPTHNSASTNTRSYLEISNTIAIQDTTRTFVEEFSDTLHKDGANTTGLWEEDGEAAKTTVGSESSTALNSGGTTGVNFELDDWWSQPFVATADGLVSKITARMTRDAGDPALNHMVVCEMRTDNAGNPSSTILARTWVWAKDIVSGSHATFNFPQRVRMANGTKYHFVFHRQNILNSVDIGLSRPSSPSYAQNARHSTNGGSSWTDSGEGLVVTVYWTPTQTGNKTIQSLGYDTGNTNNTFAAPTITKDEPTGTSVGTIEWSDSADNSSWGSWTSDLTTLSRRYVRFRTTTLNTTDTDETPRLQKITFTYTVRLADTYSITKSLQYAVKTTPTTITKSLKYCVKAPVTVQKSLKYTVRITPATVTKSLKYTVRISQTAITKSLKYTVKITQTAVTKSLKYTVKPAALSVTKSLTYRIRTATTIQKSLQYTVKAPLTIQKSLKYTVRISQAAITKSLRYAVKPTASVTKSLKYTVKYSPTAITKSLKYTLRTTPSAITKSLTYEIASATFIINKQLTYAIRKSYSITKSLQYAVKAQATVQKTLKYTVKTTPATVTKSLQYAIRSSYSITKSLQYTVKAPATIQKSLKYTVKITQATITKSLTYRVRTASTITKGLIYKVKAAVAITKSLKYTIRISQAAITKSLQYVVSGKIYSKGTQAALPTDDSSLTLYTTQQVTDVASDNNVYVNQQASDQDYAIHVYKDTHFQNTNSISASAKVKTDVAPSARPVYLQIYNYNTAAWETLDSDNTTAAGTEFTLSGSVSVNVENYYNAQNRVTCRVYQRS